MNRYVPVVFPFLLILPHAGCTHSRSPPDAASGMSPEVREGFVDATDEVRLFYRVVGSGRDTVVVIHGGPGFSMEYLVQDLMPLAGRGHTLVFYDQRGTGRSSLVSDSASLAADRFAEDLEAIRRHFRLERLTLLGHSWGAGVIALYAEQDPDRLERILIVGATPAQHGARARAFQSLAASRDTATRRRLQELRQAWHDDPGNAKACRAYYELWFLPFYGDSAAAGRTSGDFCAGTPDALRNKVRSVDRFTTASLGEWDWRPALRGVTASALVIHGTADPLPAESAREWAAMLVNGRFLLLEGIGHFPHVEAPERFFDAVETFLRGGWPENARTVTIPYSAKWGSVVGWATAAGGSAAPEGIRAESLRRDRT